MNTLQYTDIGHAISGGPVALWWIDRKGEIHEEHRDARPLSPALFESHLENHAPDPSPIAFGRVEIGASRGTIRLMSQDANREVGNVLDSLEARYPGSVWYVFNHAA